MSSIAEVKEDLKELENEMFKLVEAFESKNGVRVTSINCPAPMNMAHPADPHPVWARLSRLTVEVTL